MAFNPFNWFRKHQKVFFAGLTIMVMFVFILQFGQGDAIQQLLHRIGAARTYGQPVTKLYGKQVTDADLQRLGDRRQMASRFLLQTVLDAHTRVITDLLDRELKPSREAENPLAGVREVVERARQRTGINLLFRREDPRITLQLIQADLRFLETVAPRPGVSDNAPRLELLQQVATILGFQYWFVPRFTLTLGRMPDDYYFGGGKKLDDHLDFMVWLHQADRLGILLTDEGVVKEIIREAAGRDIFESKDRNFEQDKSVLAFLRSNRDYANQTPRDLLNALRDEFRVVMAQGFLVGFEPGVRFYRSLMGATGSPAAATPDEFLEYFRAQRTKLKVQLWTVPVAKYLDAVKETPSEQELRTRYERYRDQEPSPSAREPGFKEPRRITVEYVTASPESDYYRKEARQAVAWVVPYANPVARAASCVAAPVLAPLGAGPFGRVIAAAALALDPLRVEYDKYVQNHHAWIYPESEDAFSLADRAKRLHLQSVLQPGNIVAAVGSPAIGNGPLAALASLYAASTFHEARGAIKYNMALMLARSNPQNLLGTLTLAWPLRPEPLPLSRMQPQLLAALEAKAATDILRGHLEALRAELAKKRGSPKEAKEIIAKAVKEHHLTHLSMPEARSHHVLLDLLTRKGGAPELRLDRLKEVVTRHLSDPDRVRTERFVNTLFARPGTFEGELREGTPYEREELLWWRSEDLPARPRDYQDVRDQVVAAWRLEKARQLARREAERLEAAINAKKWTPADTERFLREQKLGEPFELDDVSQLVTPREVQAAGPTEYREYRVPDEKLEYMRYPPADLAKQLLTLKRPGESTVIADQPGKHFYVSVLIARSEPTIGEFEKLMSRTPTQDSLHGRFMLLQMAEYRKNVLEQLRREAAGKLDKEGRYDIPESIRRRESGRPSEEE
jgi:hypothetical protein